MSYVSIKGVYCYSFIVLYRSINKVVSLMRRMRGSSQEELAGSTNVPADDIVILFQLVFIYCTNIVKNFLCIQSIDH